MKTLRKSLSFLLVILMLFSCCGLDWSQASLNASAAADAIVRYNSNAPFVENLMYEGDPSSCPQVDLSDPVNSPVTLGQVAHADYYADLKNSVVAGKDFSIPWHGEMLFFRYGYRFLAWNTSPDGTGASIDYNGAYTFSGNEIVNDPDLGGIDVVNLYAQWEPVIDTLYIDPNNGGLNNPNILRVPSNNTRATQVACDTLDPKDIYGTYAGPRNADTFTVEYDYNFCDKDERIGLTHVIGSHTNIVWYPDIGSTRFDNDYILRDNFFTDYMRTNGYIEEKGCVRTAYLTDQPLEKGLESAIYRFQISDFQDKFSGRYSANNFYYPEMKWICLLAYTNNATRVPLAFLRFDNMKSGNDYVNIDLSKASVAPQNITSLSLVLVSSAIYANVDEYDILYYDFAGKFMLQKQSSSSSVSFNYTPNAQWFINEYDPALKDCIRPEVETFYVGNKGSLTRSGNTNANDGTYSYSFNDFYGYSRGCTYSYNYAQSHANMSGSQAVYIMYLTGYSGVQTKTGSTRGYSGISTTGYRYYDSDTYLIADDDPTRPVTPQPFAYQYRGDANKNCEYYAKAIWLSTFTINPNGGTYTPTDSSSASTSSFSAYLAEGQTWDLQQAGDPTKSGYIFDGWELTSKDATLDKYTVTMGAGDAAVKAVWIEEPKPYDIIFVDSLTGKQELYYMNTETGSPVKINNITNIPEGTVTSLKTSVYLDDSHTTMYPEKEGYIFSGWYKSQTDALNNNTKNAFTQNETVNSTTYMYAGWIEIQKNIDLVPEDVGYRGSYFQNEEKNTNTNCSEFEMYGVQVRTTGQEWDANGKLIDGSTNGMRYCIRLSNNLIDRVNALSSTPLVYGFMSVKKYVLDNYNKGKTGRNVMISHNQQVTEKGAKYGKYPSQRDFLNTGTGAGTYRVYTCVITGYDYTALDPGTFLDRMLWDVAVRPYIEYYDANGTKRTYFNTDPMAYSTNSTIKAKTIGGAYFNNLHYIAGYVLTQTSATDEVKDGLYNLYIKPYYVTTGEIDSDLDRDIFILKYADEFKK